MLNSAKYDSEMSYVTVRNCGKFEVTTAARRDGREVVFIISEIGLNKVSLTNCIEAVCAEIVNQAQYKARFSSGFPSQYTMKFIQHVASEDAYYEVKFAQEDGGITFTDPTWTLITEAYKVLYL